ncbi:unnamed protein product [Closterium sp. Yama58-4]|nr:unnamed protein product [Closterium sp. Yama58-4]
MATRNLQGPLFLLAVLLLSAVVAAHAQYSASGALKNIEYKLGCQGMSTSLQYMRGCGFNISLLKSLPTTKTTLLVPVNTAWGKLSSTVLAYLNKNPTKMWQVFAYHLLAGRYSAQELAAIPYSTQVVRLPTVVAQFGRPGSSSGASVKLSNVYVDIQVAVHGVDSVIVPTLI